MCKENSEIENDIKIYKFYAKKREIDGELREGEKNNSDRVC